MKQSVGEHDDKLAERMAAWEEKMKNHLADMGRRWMDKFCHQGSGSSDKVIAMAEHRIQKNVEACATQMWDRRMAQEAHNRCETLMLRFKKSVCSWTIMKEKGGVVRPALRLLLATVRNLEVEQRPCKQRGVVRPARRLVHLVMTPELFWRSLLMKVPGPGPKSSFSERCSKPLVWRGARLRHQVAVKWFRGIAEMPFY